MLHLDISNYGKCLFLASAHDLCSAFSSVAHLLPIFPLFSIALLRKQHILHLIDSTV